MSGVASRGTANHANNLRTALNQVMKEAVNLGLVPDNVAAKVKPHRVPKVRRATLEPEQVRQLLDACDERFRSAVGLCYLQGWRISEVLGLAWQDLDLAVGTVVVRRGSTNVDGSGMVLGPTKSPRAGGRHLLAPSVVALLRQRREIQHADRELLGDAWHVVEHEGEALDLVFTDRYGKPMYRQHVDRALRKAAEPVGLDRSKLGTHTGRRSVVTNLYQLAAPTTVVVGPAA
jgi:integrase